MPAKQRGPDLKPRKRGKSGGHRPGAGRPRGSRLALPRGAVAAIEAAKVSDREDELGNEAFGVVLQVMRGQIYRKPMVRLSAARDVLDRRRGKPTAHVQVTGKLTLEQAIAASYEPDDPDESGG